MAFATEVYKITRLVGNEPECTAQAEELRAVIYRTVNPSSWLQMGGLATIRTLFNPVEREWNLIVYSEILRADMIVVLNALGANLP